MNSCITSDNPLDACFSSYINDQPGAALAIIKDGEIEYQNTYGWAELESKKPVHTNTNFRLASVSKQFTATCILLLEKEGLVDLNWTLDQVFDDFPDYGKAIHIYHLLNHTSGIWDYEDYVPDSALNHQIRDQGVLDIILSVDTLYFAPGTSYRYSNTAYALLALMVEKYSGMDYPDFLERNIFSHLGMKSTVAHIKKVNTVAERAFGYSRESGVWIRKDQSSTSAVLGDGGIYSNLEDLFLWDQALYSGAILPLKTIEKSFTPGKLLNGNFIDYGLGWHLKKNDKGEKVVYHTGSSTSFRNIFYRIPEKKISLIILTNRNEPEEEEMVSLAEKVLHTWQQHHQ
ncbi:MAG: beta-lactamase family protein [Cyclobacteriaceae bacterium]|nr:beta-lactamase family protein [Cyclobacteriaceae bacterium]